MRLEFLERMKKRGLVLATLAFILLATFWGMQTTIVTAMPEDDSYQQEFDPFSLWPVGTGLLLTYIDQGRTTEAPSENGNYIVIFGTTYYFTIKGITEYDHTTISVWANYFADHFQNILIGNFQVEESPSTIEFVWTIPEPPVNGPIAFIYGINGDSSSHNSVTYEGLHWCERDWYLARKPICKCLRLPRFLCVIPEIPLGTLGAIASLISGFGARAYFRKKSKNQ